MLSLFDTFRACFGDLFRYSAGVGCNGIADSGDDERSKFAADEEQEAEGDHAPDIVSGATHELEVCAGDFEGVDGCAERGRA